MMRRKSGIEDLALFIGVGETFQLWNPTLFLADPEHSRRHEGYRPLPARGARAVSIVTPSVGEAHVPVLLEEVVAGLAITQGDTIVDGTFGAGGYARALLGAGAGRVIGFDRDPDAIANGPSLVPDPRLTADRGTLQPDGAGACATRDLLPVDGVTLDIGVSSMQLDQAERGFAFSNDGPLDMRMSQSGQTAAEFLNEADEAEIARVIRDYGEEPRARKVAEPSSPRAR